MTLIEVLYVEDDAASRDVMRMVQRLNPNRLRITLFDDSAAFLERFTALAPRPDIVLLDIHMRPYSGFDMLNMLRADAAHADMPVVALTASVMNEEVQMLRQAGFHSVIAKPLDLDLLPALLERVLHGEKVWHVQ
jgi:CheY-like chemotaxis protein